ncbi:AAA domain-containing protein [Agrobacterium sp. ST15.13.015]|uniref:AAA domain-containing protein n=1 Tax=Agrobacterium sp. ST15.13.015 TaxID=3017319 RepID=UPI003FA4B08F
MKTESTHVAGDEACVFAKYRPFIPSATLKCVGRPLYRSREARDYACLLDLDPKVSAWRCVPQPIINDSGARNPRHHYVDFAVETENEALLVDIRRPDAGTIGWIARLAEKQGYRYLAVSFSEFVGTPRIQNAKDLIRYAGYDAPLGDRIRILAALEEMGTLRVEHVDLGLRVHRRNHEGERRGGCGVASGNGIVVNDQPAVAVAIPGFPAQAETVQVGFVDFKKCEITGRRSVRLSVAHVLCRQADLFDPRCAQIDFVTHRKLALRLPCDLQDDDPGVRIESGAGAGAVASLKSMVEAGMSLRDKRHALEAHMSLRSDVRASDIDRHLGTIRGAGAFSFLSSTFKDAKSFYLAISKAGKFDKQLAIQHLGAARDQLEEEARFNTRATNSGVFGARFDGVDTDFESFGELAAFYENVDAQFSGFNNREVRDFLRSEIVDTLINTPSLPDLPPEAPLRDLAETCAKLESKLEELKSTDVELKLLSQIFHRPAAVTSSDVRKFANDVRELQELVGKLDRSELAVVLGSHFDGWKSKSDEIDYLVEVARLLHKHRFGTAFALAARERRLQELLSSSKLAHDAAQNAQGLLARVSGEGLLDMGAKINKLTYAQASEYLSAASKDVEALAHWTNVAKSRSEIDRLGLLETVDLLVRQVGTTDVSGHVEALLRRVAAGRVYEKYGRELVNYSGRQLEALRSRLKSLDDEITLLSRKALRHLLISGSRPPAGNARGRVAEYTEMGLLEHLAGQKKIRVPVREVTKRAGRALLALKPCWMMSPLAVAQYIQKNTLEFDICIIDEASQMPPEDAIGALFRSRQAMIVGDTQQLPPTNFFHKSIADTADDEETDAVTEESVLEMANSAFRPRRMLTWHYRSKHSGLIRFSNGLIYRDRLTVFPSANEDNPRMGVSLVQTNGIYKAGVNTTEAHAVVEAALDFMRHDPTRSLGIVAVNKAQADYINERLQYEIARDAAAGEFVDRWLHERDGLEEFFVKNLENVQGDERDVIFVSTVYGPPSEGGKVAQHFGPIAGPTGRRRLNVLFTRAKEQIRTFTSMTPSDITAEETSNPGAWMLKRWLEYSAGGPLQAGTGTHGAFDSPLEEFVAAQIESMGCVAVPQVGAGGYSIDLGVRHPQWPHGFLMGVECDGAAYHSSRSARDRDRHRQEILERLGWNIHRVWSTDWFDDPRREAERLRAAIGARLEQLKTKLAEQAVVSVPPPRPATATATTKNVRHAGVEQLVLPVDAPAVKPDRFPPAVAKSGVVRLGSKVRLRYLDRGQETYQFTIVKDPSAPEKGLVNRSAPLAKAVLDAEAGDELEILLGSLIRKAVVESVS